MMLESMGFAPDFADNGREAVERALAHRYDLILMDVEMPVMDGMEAARAIRAYSNDETRPWIIGVSAHVFDDQRDEIMAAGMNDFVAKPVRLPELAAALQRGLASADAEASPLSTSPAV
jgi:CheY-like chemotaxis protein